jgi:hypothetical protein
MRATVPPEVPELPSAMQARPALLAVLKQRVLCHGGGTTAVVAAGKQGEPSYGLARKNTTSACGMGGTGKTTAAAQLIQDPEVGESFERLLWATVGQAPVPCEILRVLYRQLTSNPLPERLKEDHDAVQALREAAMGKRVLLVLDDVWEQKHGELFNCVDTEAGSAVVVTTRMRGLAADGGEVSCGLLSTPESLALLLRSAGLEHLCNDWTSPELEDRAATIDRRVKANLLQARALKALAEGSGEDEVRAWLPPPSELIFLASHDWNSKLLLFGMGNPSLLCARLYADHLSAWEEAARIAEGILAIPPFEMNPITHIEAGRLLARCCGARGDSAGARAALERVVRESREIECTWIERRALEDLNTWSG